MWQRELENMQNKKSPPVDTDILRMKIAKNMEVRHRIELEIKQQALLAKSEDPRDRDLIRQLRCDV